MLCSGEIRLNFNLLLLPMTLSYKRREIDFFAYVAKRTNKIDLFNSLFLSIENIKNWMAQHRVTWKICGLIFFQHDLSLFFGIVFHKNQIMSDNV